MGLETGDSSLLLEALLLQFTLSLVTLTTLLELLG